jgi:hypothetical protein
MAKNKYLQLQWVLAVLAKEARASLALPGMSLPMPDA